MAVTVTDNSVQQINTALLSLRKEVDTLIDKSLRESKKVNNLAEKVDTESNYYVTAADLLSIVYPVGSIYISINNVNPSTFIGGSWTKVSSGRVLQGADSSHAAGTTIEAGIPNITATIDNTDGVYGVVGFDGNCTSGAFSGSNPGNTHTGNTGSASIKKLSFNAASGEVHNGIYRNDVYGKSDTVQPPAYVVYFWKRTA